MEDFRSCMEYDMDEYAVLTEDLYLSLSAIKAYAEFHGVLLTGLWDSNSEITPFDEYFGWGASGGLSNSLET